MTRQSRMLFIDGPDDGLTIPLEGEPPSEWLTPGHASPSIAANGNLDFNIPKHRYIRIGNTRGTAAARVTYIYEYQGQQ